MGHVRLHSPAPNALSSGFAAIILSGPDVGRLALAAGLFGVIAAFKIENVEIDRPEAMSTGR